LKPYDREQLLDLFNDAEQVIHEFIRFAADRGLLEKVEQDLE
jgi:hypothetical protein